MDGYKMFFLKILKGIGFYVDFFVDDSLMICWWVI